jgi:hypothetical protein
MRNKHKRSIDNKDDQTKRIGSLWLCQKPSFDVGYSVPLRKGDGSQAKQAPLSTANGNKKTWTMEDDDLIDTDQLLDDNDRKKPDVKSKTSHSCLRRHECFFLSRI